MKATNEDVVAVANLVLELCGIYLDTSKGYLIENRLAPMARRLGCNSFSALAQLVRHNSDTRLRSDLIDAISTNETLFSATPHHSRRLKNKVLPIGRCKGAVGVPRRLRIWSAAWYGTRAL